MSRNRPRAADLPSSTVALIRERNTLDLELYDHARKGFERDLAAVDDLEDELDLLRLAARCGGRAGGAGGAQERTNR